MTKISFFPGKSRTSEGSTSNQPAGARGTPAIVPAFAAPTADSAAAALSTRPSKRRCCAACPAAGPAPDAPAPGAGTAQTPKEVEHVRKLWKDLPRDLWDRILSHLAVTNRCLDVPKTFRDSIERDYLGFGELPLAWSSKAPHAAWIAPDSYWQAHLLSRTNQDRRSNYQIFSSTEGLARLPYFSWLNVGGPREQGKEELVSAWHLMAERGKALRTLNISKPVSLRSKDFLGISSLTQLEKVFISGYKNQLGDSLLESISNLTNLRQLKVNADAQDELDCDQYRGGPAHTESVRISAAGLRTLSCLLRLERLELSGHYQMNIQDTQWLVKLSGLKLLFINGWQGMTYQKIGRIVAQFPHLNLLSFDMAFRSQNGILMYSEFDWWSGTPQILKGGLFSDGPYKITRGNICHPILIPPDHELRTLRLPINFGSTWTYPAGERIVTIR